MWHLVPSTSSHISHPCSKAEKKKERKTKERGGTMWNYPRPATERKEKCHTFSQYHVSFARSPFKNFHTAYPLSAKYVTTLCPISIILIILDPRKHVSYPCLRHPGPQPSGSPNTTLTQTHLPSALPCVSQYILFYRFFLSVM